MPQIADLLTPIACLENGSIIGSIVNEEVKTESRTKH